MEKERILIGAHPSAIVDGKARIGEGTEIGPWSLVEGDVQIGSGCRLASGVVVKNGTRLGDDNQLFEGVVLGGPPQDLGFRSQASELVIGCGNIFREGVTIHRSSRPEIPTRIGDDNYFMAYSHVAHDCELGSRIVMANNVCLAGHIQIEDQAFISGGVVIHQFSRIGRLSMIGGNAKIVQDVLPFFLADGIPGRHRGLNIVGLKRAGIGLDGIRALKKAFKILFGPGRLVEKLVRIKEIDSPQVGHLADFVGGSKRGFCGR